MGICAKARSHHVYNVRQLQQQKPGVGRVPQEPDAAPDAVSVSSTAVSAACAVCSAVTVKVPVWVLEPQTKTVDIDVPYETDEETTVSVPVTSYETVNETVAVQKQVMPQPVQMVQQPVQMVQQPVQQIVQQVPMQMHTRMMPSSPRMMPQSTQMRPSSPRMMPQSTQYTS